MRVYRRRLDVGSSVPVRAIGTGFDECSDHQGYVRSDHDKSESEPPVAAPVWIVLVLVLVVGDLEHGKREDVHDSRQEMEESGAVLVCWKPIAAGHDETDEGQDELVDQSRQQHPSEASE